MERIIVQVRDKEKAKMLLEFLAALDFVDSVKQSEMAEAEASPTAQEVSLDFFSLAGLWKDREVSLESLCANMSETTLPRKLESSII